MQSKSKFNVMLLVIIIILLVFGLVYFFSKSSKQNIKIEFLSGEKLDIKNSKFTISLYGYDESMADVSATLITEKTYNAISVPFSIILPYPSNATSLIEKQNGDSVGKASYYIAIEWDSNNDGKPGTTGDISLDWNNKKWDPFRIKLINGSMQTVYLAEIK